MALQGGIATNAVLTGGHSAGEPGIGNREFMADAFSLAAPGLVSDKRLSSLTLGSYQLNTFVLKNDPTTRTATVAFIGTNEMSLGSAVAADAGTRSLGDKFAPASGPLSTAKMNFGWTETVHY